MNKELVLATHNEGKVRELQELLASCGFHIRSAASLGLPEPEETGDSFAANAALKAHAAASASHTLSLADDSGLVVPALDGAPGIYSARWAGPNKDFSAAAEKIHRQLVEKNIPQNQWHAYFSCHLCLALPDGNQFDFEGRVNGMLCFPARGTQGFGYDPVFIPDGYAHSFAEMEPQLKNRLSHRAQALKKLTTFLETSDLIR